MDIPIFFNMWFVSTSMELTLDILYMASRFVSKNAAPVIYYFMSFSY